MNVIDMTRLDLPKIVSQIGMICSRNLTQDEINQLYAIKYAVDRKLQVAEAKF